MAHVSKEALRRLAAGEVGEVEAERLAHHALACQSCRVLAASHLVGMAEREPPAPNRSAGTGHGRREADREQPAQQAAEITAAHVIAGRIVDQPGAGFERCSIGKVSAQRLSAASTTARARVRSGCGRQSDPVETAPHDQEEDGGSKDPKEERRPAFQARGEHEAERRKRSAQALPRRTG
jgi:hypothetical protein